MKIRAWRSALFYTCFILALIYWDLILRLLSICSIRAAREWANRCAPETCRIVFAISRYYLDHRILVSESVRRSALPAQFMLVSNH